MQHEVSEGFVSKVGKNYYMILSVDGVRQQRKTGTNDLDEATEMLADWKADLIRGIEQGTKLKYEDMREAYLAHKPQVAGTSALRDLDNFFGGMRLSSITTKLMQKFKSDRESNPETAEYEQEQIQKEYALRVRRAETNGGRELARAEKERLLREATTWAKNGTKATTNKRLSMLRAMFYSFLEKEQAVEKHDLPSYFPLYPSEGTNGVDNVKEGFLTTEQFRALVKKLPEDLRSIATFIYVTGMRTNAARSITWEMIDRDCKTLVVPKGLMKNKTALTLPLVNKKTGEPRFEFITKAKRGTGLVFAITEARLRNEWRKTCHELGHGVFDKKTRGYRGLSLHDFRRSAIRNLRNAGNAEEVAMKISGHKTASTFKRYSIVDAVDTGNALDSVAL